MLLDRTTAFWQNVYQLLPGTCSLSTCLAALLYNALGTLCGLLPGSPEPSYVEPLDTRLLTNLVAR